jgi:hypothetical protein
MLACTTGRPFPIHLSMHDLLHSASWRGNRPKGLVETRINHTFPIRTGPPLLTPLRARMFIPPVEITSTFNESSSWTEYAANQHFVLQQNKTPTGTAGSIVDGLAASFRTLVDTFASRQDTNASEMSDSLSTNFPRASPPVSPKPSLRRHKKTVVDFKYRIVLRRLSDDALFVVGAVFIEILFDYDVQRSAMDCVIFIKTGSGLSKTCFGTFCARAFMR